MNRMLPLVLLVIVTSCCTAKDMVPAEVPPDGTAAGRAWLAEQAAASAEDQPWPDLSTLRPDTNEQIAALVGKLADKEFKVRQAAEERLKALGELAREAVEKAAASDDPEVAFRARRILQAMADAPALVDRRKALVDQATALTWRGKYGTAANLLVQAIRLGPSINDLCQLGHLCQLAGRWEDAIRIYRLVVATYDARTAAAKATTAPAAPDAGDGKWEYKDSGWVLEPPTDDAINVEVARVDADFTSQSRVSLLLVIGRIQRDKLKDLNAACESFAAGAEVAESDYALSCLQELAALQEQGGQLKEALATWGRIHKFSPYVDFAAVRRLAAKWPADEALPPGIKKEHLAADPQDVAADKARLIVHVHPPQVNVMLDKRILVRRDLMQEDVPPGRHMLEFANRIPPKALLEADLAAGRTYGLYASLNSPFDIRLTNLPALGPQHADRFNSASIVELADGRWLAAWSAAGRLMVSTSKDRLVWDEPWSPSPASVARDESPMLVSDGEGGAWLVWLSNRLELQVTSMQWTPFVAHTRDGKEWSLPQPIRNPGLSGPPHPPRLIRAGDGQWRLYWWWWVAAGKSPRELTPLVDLKIDGFSHESAHTSAVAVDSTGRWHMVIAWSKVLYSTSADGVLWSRPSDLFESAVGRSPSRPQLLAGTDRLFLFYTDSGGMWMRQVTTGDKIDCGGEVSIAGGMMRPQGSHVTLTEDGRLLMLCGPDGVWLMEADVAPKPAAEPAD